MKWLKRIYWKVRTRLDKDYYWKSVSRGVFCIVRGWQKKGMDAYFCQQKALQPLRGRISPKGLKALANITLVIYNNPDMTEAEFVRECEKVESQKNKTPGVCGQAG